MSIELPFEFDLILALFQKNKFLSIFLKMPIPWLIQLGALQQQIEYGDTPGDLSLDMNLAPIELNGRVIDEHRLLRGKSQLDAIDEFLAVATRLQNYGIELHDKMQLDGNHAEVMRSTYIW